MRSSAGGSDLHRTCRESQHEAQIRPQLTPQNMLNVADWDIERPLDSSNGIFMRAFSKRR